MPKKIRPQKKPRKISRVVAVVIMTALLAVGCVFVYTARLVKAPTLPEPGLKYLAEQRGVHLGVLTYPKHLKNDVFVQVLTSQYSMIVSDGELHWDKFRPTASTYNYTPFDLLVDFAERNNMRVQAHHLVWDEDDSLPKWLKNGNYNKEQVYEYMQKHITETVGRYKGHVAEWTVVNEPFTRAKHMYGLDNWWGSKLGGGTEYIDKAFIWARQADPKAKLILNDFDNEVANTTSDAQYAYMKSAKERGIPIDGIGMQIHVDASRAPSKAAMIKNMRRFADLGYKVYVTEFDIDSSRVDGSQQRKREVEAQITADVVRACIESKGCESFVVFGMTDITKLQSFTHTKRRANLLDKRFQPKPAFYSFRDAWVKP